MYDLHNHILPSIDDGAPTRDEALAMAEIADYDGTLLTLATPHRKDVTEAHAFGTIRTLVAELNQELEQRNLKVRLVLGMENHIDPDLPEATQTGHALTMNNSRYILVELPFFQFPNYVHDVLFRLRLQGLTPVIAHPERQSQIQDNSDILSRLIENGALAQITAGSIIGSFGEVARRSAQQLLKRRLVHIIASDCHRARGDRTPILSAGQAAAAKIVGATEARMLTVDNPRALLNNLDFEPVAPLPKTKRSWWIFRH
jgi:protein-tyrosine phosphatase